MHMKQSLKISACLFALCCLGVSQAARSEMHPEITPTLLRAALIVADAEKSIAFYSALGFRIEADNTSPRQPENNPFPLNAPSTQVRLVIMQSASGAGGRIGLVNFTNPTPQNTRTAPGRVGRGDVVLVFDVKDAVAIHTQLLAEVEKLGAYIIEPPQIYKSKRTDTNGRPLTGKVFHLTDPDGYLIELLEAAH